jgi:hypothetical protein
MLSRIKSLVAKFWAWSNRNSTTRRRNAKYPRIVEVIPGKNERRAYTIIGAPPGQSKAPSKKEYKNIEGAYEDDPIYHLGSVMPSVYCCWHLAQSVSAHP